MPTEAVWGSESSTDRQYRRPTPSKPVRALPSADGESGQPREEHHTLLRGRVRLLVDDEQHIMKVQLLDPGSGTLIQEIPAEELEDHDLRGTLVDLDT